MAVRKRKGDKENKSEPSLSTTKASSEHPSPALPSDSSTPFPWLGLLVAVLFFALGIITPLLQEPSKQSSIPSSTGFPVITKVTKDGSQQAAKKDQRQTIEKQQQNTEASDMCSKEALADFLHGSPVPGFHVVCLKPVPSSKMINFRFYRGALAGNPTSEVNLPLPLPWSDMQAIFGSELHTPEHRKGQPWAVFSAKGQRLVSADSVEESPGYYAEVLSNYFGLVLVFEGGQFLWPGVRIGFERTVELYSIMPDTSPDMGDKKQVVTLETLSLEPLVLSVKGFLSVEECDHIQEKASPSLRYSDVVLMDKDAGRPASDFRTSQTTFLSANDDDILLDIDYRTASLVRIPRNHQEPVQALRYGPGERYKAHVDFFDPSLYKQDQSTLKLIDHGRRNRMVTVFWYLSEVEAGGETIFPRSGGGHPIDNADCETGLKVRPEKGKVIIFYSMTPDGKTDQKSLHGACPVKEGVKWAGYKWVWNEPMGYVSA